MASKKAAAKTKDRGTRTEAYLGTITYKRKGKTITHGVISRTFQDIIDLLNLKVPTEAQLKGEGGRELNGYKGTKSIQIQHPSKTKTPGGSIKVVHLPVPGVAKASDIRKWLQGTKAEYFRMDGRWRRVGTGK